MKAPSSPQIPLIPIIILTALLILFVGNALLVSLDRPWRPAASRWAEPVTEWTGVIHVHTRYSDGSGTVESVALAAEKAGADFVIITDHNDERSYAEAGYRHGVLVLAGDERSTEKGHMLVIGAPGIEGRDADRVAEEADRAGGIAIVSHPFGRRSWEGAVPPFARGYEIINADSEWRDDSPLELISSLLALPVLPRAPWNRLIDRPTRNLTEFDFLSLLRPIVPIASVDAHAAIEIFKGKLLPFPSYEAIFSGPRTHVLLDRPPTGDGTVDTRLVIEALRAGRVFLGHDGLGESRGFLFQVSAGDIVAGPGESITAESAEIIVQIPLPGETRIRVFRDGLLWKEGRGPRYRTSAGPGVYRVEIVQVRRTDRPWIFSAPIRIISELSSD